MTKFLALALLLAALGACHDDRGPKVTVGGVGAAPAPTPTRVVLQVKNTDCFDYALWLEWQDETGAWVQNFLFPVYGDPAVGPVQDYELLWATPGIPYTLLLADPAGSLYDWRDFSVPEGSVSYVTFEIVGGFLIRTM